MMQEKTEDSEHRHKRVFSPRSDSGSLYKTLNYFERENVSQRSSKKTKTKKEQQGCKCASADLFTCSKLVNETRLKPAEPTL